MAKKIKAKDKFCSSCEHALIGELPRGHGMPDEEVLFCTYNPPIQGKYNTTLPELYCSKYDEAK